LFPIGLVFVETGHALSLAAIINKPQQFYPSKRFYPEEFELCKPHILANRRAAVLVTYIVV